jgi:hypothetical protein
MNYCLPCEFNIYPASNQETDNLQLIEENPVMEVKEDCSKLIFYSIQVKFLVKESN